MNDPYIDDETSSQRRSKPCIKLAVIAAVCIIYGLAIWMAELILGERGTLACFLGEIERSIHVEWLWSFTDDTTHLWWSLVIHTIGLGLMIWRASDSAAIKKASDTELTECRGDWFAGSCSLNRDHHTHYTGFLPDTIPFLMFLCAELLNVICLRWFEYNWLIGGLWTVLGMYAITCLVFQFLLFLAFMT